MRRAPLAMVAVGLLLGAGQPRQPEAKDPAEELQGGWRMVMLSVQRRGNSGRRDQGRRAGRSG